MSKSLKAAAAAAFDAKEYESLMDESQKYLAKFIKEKPNHPDAMIAMAAWGDFLVKRRWSRSAWRRPSKARTRSNTGST